MARDPNKLTTTTPSQAPGQTAPAPASSSGATPSQTPGQAAPAPAPAGSGTPPTTDTTPTTEPVVELMTVKLRHKTPYPRYRRAGVVLTHQAQDFQVTQEQLDVLTNDEWVELVQEEAQEDAEA